MYERWHIFFFENSLSIENSVCQTLSRYLCVVLNVCCVCVCVWAWLCVCACVCVGVCVFIIIILIFPNMSLYTPLSLHTHTHTYSHTNTQAGWRTFIWKVFSISDIEGQVCLNLYVRSTCLVCVCVCVCVGVGVCVVWFDRCVGCVGV